MHKKHTTTKPINIQYFIYYCYSDGEFSAIDQRTIVLSKLLKKRLLESEAQYGNFTIYC